MNCSLMTRAGRTRTPSPDSYENDVHIKCTNAHRDTNIKTCVFMISASPKLTGDKNNEICKWQRPTGWRRQGSSSSRHTVTVDTNYVTEKEEDAVSGIDTVNRQRPLSVSNEHTQCIYALREGVSALVAVTHTKPKAQRPHRLGRQPGARTPDEVWHSRTQNRAKKARFFVVTRRTYQTAVKRAARRQKILRKLISVTTFIMAKVEAV